MTILPQDHTEATRIATLAGELLMKVREDLVAKGVEGKEMKDEGDRQAHELIMRELTASMPDDAILSEEGKDDHARLTAERTWIVDPLDGTREFSEPPRDDWAVHVALVIGGKAVAGAVALPGAGITLNLSLIHI